jgi:hypothetical protein
MKNNSYPAAALAGLCAAAMLACKETAVIHFFALGTAGIVWQMVERKNRRSATGQPEAGLEQVASAAPGSRFKLLAIASGVFVAASILLFTWFGQNWSALADLFQAIPNFAARASGQGHAKPFSYYFSVLDPLFIFSIAGAIGVYSVVCNAFAGTRRAGLWIAVYGLLIFVIYSALAGA